jgi:hypothetical protein
MGKLGICYIQFSVTNEERDILEEKKGRKKSWRQYFLPLAGMNPDSD